MARAVQLLPMLALPIPPPPAEQRGEGRDTARHLLLSSHCPRISSQRWTQPVPSRAWSPFGCGSLGRRFPAQLLFLCLCLFWLGGWVGGVFLCCCFVLFLNIQPQRSKTKCICAFQQPKQEMRIFRFVLRKAIGFHKLWKIA